MNRLIISALVLVLAAAAAIADTSIPINSSKVLSIVAKDAGGNVVTPVSYSFAVSNARCSAAPISGPSTTISTGGQAGDCTVTATHTSGVVATEVVTVTPGPPTQFVVTWQ